MALKISENVISKISNKNRYFSMHAMLNKLSPFFSILLKKLPTPQLSPDSRDLSVKKARAKNK
jgi:hypothetical protein